MVFGAEEMVSGKVTAMRDYGAVVALACGVDGLLHISQISSTYVKNVSDALSLGDEVRCVVIKVDEEDGSVSLSTKMLEAKPGEMLRNATAVFERADERADASAGAA